MIRAIPPPAQAASTAQGSPARAPWKYSTARSRVAPAPGGSHWPIVPHGRGSSSGADVAPANGLPRANVITAPRAMPTAARPLVPASEPSPVTVAATASAMRPITPASVK